MEDLKEGTLVGFGNPLLDISANVDDSYLEKYDLNQDGAILAEEKHKPLYKELMEHKTVQYMAGGSCQNTLRVAQWILKKPKVAVFFGCVGSDECAEKLAEKALSDGVNVRYQKHDSEPTGTCGVLITGHHRSLCANLAAANHFTIDHIETPDNKALLEAAKIVYITGFFLTASAETALHVAKSCHTRDIPLTMNLSAPFVSQFHKQELLDMLPYVDIIFGNELEAAAFATELNFETDDLHEIALKISKLPKQNEKRGRVAIITQGKNSVLLARNGKVTEVAVKKLDADKIVDTNGAGDAFVGGFLAQFVLGKPLEVCIDSGTYAAQQIIQRHGCSFEGESNFVEEPITSAASSKIQTTD